MGSRSGRINQSICTFLRFVIGLVLPFQLSTPTIRFSLDHKRNVSDEAVSVIGMLLSLDHKLYASDYYSDSVASENQHLQTVRCMMYKLTSSYLETAVLVRPHEKGNLRCFINKNKIHSEVRFQKPGFWCPKWPLAVCVWTKGYNGERKNNHHFQK